MPPGGDRRPAGDERRLCYDDSVTPAPSGRPTDRPVVWRQLLLGLLVFGCYVAVDALDSPGRREAAQRHGHQLLDLEQRLHLDVEHWLNDGLAAHRTLATLANYEYAWSYILSAALVLAWVWWRRPDLWSATRDSFIVLNVVAIASFALYPTAPPRMLGGAGFVDTVQRVGTVGSWGSGIVDTANQMAAMPSLHVGWALWVSAVLARMTAHRRLQLLSATHVLVTGYVVMATANHYLLDAVAVVVPVWLGMRYAAWRYDAPEAAGVALPSCDAFFLHVEDAGAPQHVGGVAIFAASTGEDPVPSLEAIRELVRTRLAAHPPLDARLAPASRWRRPRWVPADVDLDRHVVERRSTSGEAGLYAIVAGLAEEPLPRDRPLWRVLLVRDVGPGRSALVLVVHHAVADGIGTVVHALDLFDPRVALPLPGGTSPGILQRAAATTVGLAQLATDGTAPALAAAPLAGEPPHRQYATARLDLDVVRRLAREHGVRVTDVVLALVAEAVAETSPQIAARTRHRLRVSITQMVRAPGAGPEGNATAAVMVDLPLEEMPFDRRLADIARRTADRLHRPTRAVASRFVMATGLRLLPEPAAAWFARTVYGGRFFHAVVSNMPGPPQRLTMAGVETEQVYPVLPVAPGAPLSVGALSWDGALGVGLATDPAWFDAPTLARHVGRAAAGLAADARAQSGGRTGQERARNRRARSRGESSASPNSSRT